MVNNGLLDFVVVNFAVSIVSIVLHPRYNRRVCTVCNLYSVNKYVWKKMILISVHKSEDES